MPRSSFVRLLHAAGLAAIAVPLAACGVTAVQGDRSWGAGLSDTEGHSSVINVTDHSGKVQDVDFEAAVARAGPGAAPVPGEPSQIDVSWVGGKCDASTTVDIAPAGPGLTVKVSIQPDGQPCDAIGVAKAIRLKLAQPIPPGLVAVHQ